MANGQKLYLMLFCFHTHVIFLPDLFLISVASYFLSFATALPSPYLCFKLPLDSLTLARSTCP